MRYALLIFCIFSSGCAAEHSVPQSQSPERVEVSSATDPFAPVQVTNANSNGNKWAMPVGGFLNDRATSLPKPTFPTVPSSYKFEEAVKVAVLVDETGKVYSAVAVAGPTAMRQPAEEAALSSEITPMIFNGQPVKFSGFLVYEIPQD